MIHGQAALTVDRTNALIGDQLELTLHITAPAGTEWKNPDVVPADTVAAVDVVHAGDLQRSDQGGQTQIVKTWTIAAFDTGVIRIPPLPVVLQNASGTDTQYTNDIPLMISGVTDSMGLAPIKPIIREPARLSDYMPYLIGVAGLCLLIAAGIWLSRRKPKGREVIEIRDEKPAHIIALDQLDALEREKLWQQGQVKEYHSRMNHIMRMYLQRRFGVPALESTTGEIMRYLRSHTDLDDTLLDEVREVMQVEDLIKFAKAEPHVDIHAQYLEFARSLILKTKEVPQSEDAHA